MLLLTVATSSAVYVLKPLAPDDLASGNVGVLGLAAGRFPLDKFSTFGSYIGPYIIISVIFCVGLMLTAD